MSGFDRGRVRGGEMAFEDVWVGGVVRSSRYLRRAPSQSFALIEASGSLHTCFSSGSRRGRCSLYTVFVVRGGACVCLCWGGSATISWLITMRKVMAARE